MPIDLDFIDEDLDIIEIRELNDLDVTALGAMFIKYANTNNPKNETEEGYYFPTQDETCNPNKDYFIGDGNQKELFEGNEFAIGITYYECNGAFNEKVNNHGYPYEYLGIYVGVTEPLTVKAYEWCIRDVTSIKNTLIKIQQDLSQEVIDRQNEDTNLQGNIDALDTRLTNRIADEENARNQGDTALENSKQNKLVSGQNIKTINGQDVLGSGDLRVSFDPQSLSTLHMLCYEEVEDNE